jgi:hypothetical protein
MAINHETSFTVNPFFLPTFNLLTLSTEDRPVDIDRSVVLLS